MEERSLHRLLLLILKIIPMILALLCAMNTVLSYFGIDLIVLSYIGGISAFPLLFLYLSSYAFRFCGYHRMFLHYVAINWILNIYDYYVGIPLSDRGLLTLYLTLLYILMFVILYLYLRRGKQV